MGGALEQLRPAGTERQKQGSSNGKTEQMLYAIKYLGTYREKITRATGFEVTSSPSRKESSYKTVQSSHRKNTPPQADPRVPHASRMGLPIEELPHRKRVGEGG